MAVNIIDARPTFAQQLSDIAIRSKAHWGYDAAFMQAAEAELKVTEKQIKSHNSVYRCLVDEKNAILGFYGLSLSPDLSYLFENPMLLYTETKLVSGMDEIAELEALFVAPENMRQQLGRILFNDAAQTSRQNGVKVLLIQSDPYAQSFYEKMQCHVIGCKASGSIPGRTLPLMKRVL